MTYDRAYWEQLWAKTLRDHPEKVAQRPPNAHLIAEVAHLRPGRVLDAGYVIHIDGSIGGGQILRCSLSPSAR
jgi:hypothetical protein